MPRLRDVERFRARVCDVAAGTALFRHAIDRHRQVSIAAAMNEVFDGLAGVAVFLGVILIWTGDTNLDLVRGALMALIGLIVLIVSQIRR
jgi:divalent metal cation (Fe/Co/Zn/Cd) transporter